MPGLEIRPFSDEHLAEAAATLSARHERRVARQPLLSSLWPPRGFEPKFLRLHPTIG